LIYDNPDEYLKEGKDRNTAIVTAYRSGEYTMSVIGAYFDLHYSTVSGIIANHKPTT